MIINLKKGSSLAASLGNWFNHISVVTRSLPTPYFQDKWMYTTLRFFNWLHSWGPELFGALRVTWAIIHPHLSIDRLCELLSKTPVYLPKISLAGFHINAAAYRICTTHVYCRSFSIRITSTRGRMWWKWKRQRISPSIVAWWWCSIQVYFMLRTQEILKCDSIRSIWGFVWLTERIHIDLPWSIIVSGLSILWLGGDAQLRSRRHWTSVWKPRWIHYSQSVSDPHHWLAGDLAEHEC